MTFTEFFDAQEATTDKIVFRLKELAEINPLRMVGDKSEAEVDGISLRQVGGLAKHQVQMRHETYDPDADNGEELYTHEAEEAGLVVSR